MTKTCLNKCIRTVKHEMNDIYNSGITGYDLFYKLDHLCRDISDSDDFKTLTFLEIESLLDVFIEILDENFLITRKV